jgi:hypothetical protein
LVPLDNQIWFRQADAIRLANVSPMTWLRLKRQGEGPPVTQISPRRVGYRLIDLIRWLDARRHGPGVLSTPAALCDEIEMIRAAVKLACGPDTHGAAR